MPGIAGNAPLNFSKPSLIHARKTGSNQSANLKARFEGLVAKINPFNLIRPVYAFNA
jgi:hypothetical protein